MSLKTDYFDGLTGFNAKMSVVYDAGKAFVVTNSAILTSALQAAAASGKKSFIVTIDVPFEPSNLRLQGIHMKTFLAGIVEQMGTEDIYSYEVTPTLNTSDCLSTSIDFKFTF